MSDCLGRLAEHISSISYSATSPSLVIRRLLSNSDADLSAAG